uniref:Uncharacterized protein n=1 Tax=Tetranychus urticae TaxID=32264 RepID=T1K6R1_TETUR
MNFQICPSPKILIPLLFYYHFFYNGHTDEVRSVDVESEGQFIVSGGDDSTCRIWEGDYFAYLVSSKVFQYSISILRVLHRT